MSENNGQVAMTDPIEQSKGGLSGHLFRRVIHLSLSFIPFIYFEYGEECAEFLGLELPQLVSTIVLLMLAAEAVRLKFSITIFGQREYEAHQVSALA